MRKLTNLSRLDNRTCTMYPSPSHLSPHPPLVHNDKTGNFRFSTFNVDHEYFFEIIPKFYIIQIFWYLLIIYVQILKGMKNLRGGPLEIEIFFVEEVNERVGGGSGAF